MKAIIKEGKYITLETAKRTNIKFEFEKGFYSLKYATDEFINLLGFKDVEVQQLTEHQRQGGFYLDEKTDTIKFNVIDLSIEEIEEIEKVEKKNQRNELLTKGVIVSNIWFNEEKLTQFTVNAQMCKAAGVTSFEWGFESGWGLVGVDDAFRIAVQASNEFSLIYKQNA